MHKLTAILLTSAWLLLTSHGSAWAYIGPGAGISAVGTVVALLGALVLMIVGFVWYPVKRLRRKLREARNPGEVGGP